MTLWQYRLKVFTCISFLSDFYWIPTTPSKELGSSWRQIRGRFGHSLLDDVKICWREKVPAGNGSRRGQAVLTLLLWLSPSIISIVPGPWWASSRFGEEKETSNQNWQCPLPLSTRHGFQTKWTKSQSSSTTVQRHQPRKETGAPKGSHMQGAQWWPTDRLSPQECNQEASQSL